eukprot:gb/GECH01008269.1/.p1 GENE.gb/GECH01008269.1/~~gb/GECH01008269.1/.p1  ORF type:complete len:360 (+),score=48.00 gb/GECH01008269.1/:1-1080(+)
MDFIRGYGFMGGYTGMFRDVNVLYSFKCIDILEKNKDSPSIQCLACGYDQVLGICDSKDKTLFSFSLNNVPSSFENIYLKQITACLDMFGGITETNQIWLWGSISLDPQLCKGNNTLLKADQPLIIPNNLTESIIQIAISSNSIFALSERGTVFQVALEGKKPYLIPSLVEIPSQIEIKKITCGWNHTVALTKEGECFSWGNSSHGQCGHVAMNSQKAIKIEEMEGLVVKSAACGAAHTLLMTDTGDLYGMGNNTNGQIGCEFSSVVQPTLIEEFSGPDLQQKNILDDVESIAAGSRHSVVSLKDGTVVGCGWNGYGQLGPLMRDNTSVPTMSVIEQGVRKDTQISCGPWTTLLLSPHL